MSLENSINYLAVTDMHKWKLKDFFTVIITIACLILAVNTIGALFNAGHLILNSPYHHWWNLVLFLIQEVIFIVPVYVLIIRKYRLSASALGFVRIKFWQIIKWILKGFGLVLLFNILFALITARFEIDFPGFDRQISHVPLFGTTPFGIVLGIIVLIVIAPVVEELIFRGFVLQTFLGRFKPIIANIISAGIFAIIHFEFQSIGIILFLAFVLNWIFMRSKSIWPCIGFHMLNNAIVFLVEILEWQGYLS